jgi:CheY-like chemotaxis protein/HPt (histidine-containing phosphotransfer) domain-containing protein
VEDSQLNAEVVTAMIARTGCDYDLVGDGASALEALTQRPYDLVLMDCHLPDAQGPNLAFDIRCREAQGDFAHERRRIPIVAFTASATKADMEKYRAAGMDDCIAKPTDLPVVMAVLRRHLTPGGDGTRSGNLERTLLRLSGDRELLARIIGQFVTAAAESRINLREACEGRDAHALKFHVHRLRGQASTFDAAYLVRATEKLEESIRDDGVVWPLADAALLAIDAELDRLLAYLAREAVFP